MNKLYFLCFLLILIMVEFVSNPLQAERRFNPSSPAIYTPIPISRPPSTYTHALSHRPKVSSSTVTISRPPSTYTHALSHRPKVSSSTVTLSNPKRPLKPAKQKIRTEVGGE
ncbi:hypothetical protein HYY75_03025 [bacterium]|nr:hypothetical protein [bacterium]